MVFPVILICVKDVSTAVGKSTEVGTADLIMVLPSSFKLNFRSISTDFPLIASERRTFCETTPVFVSEMERKVVFEPVPLMVV